MTDEQIKQNAEAYASYFYPKNSTVWQDRYNAYIAGAHSRNEEIKELNNLLEARRESLFQSTKRITELKMENNQLRNPWISVKERLPEEGDEIILKRDYVSSYFRKVRAEDIRFIEYSEPNAKWMLIPKLK